MSKRTPLVCQFLEQISRKALEKYQGVIKDFVRRRHGIYALYRRDRLYYVGLASNLRNRLRGHLKGRHAKHWDRFSVYLTIGDSHIRELESLVLRIMSPSGNKQRGKLVRAENLSRSLRKMLREQYRKEMQELFGRRGKEPAILSAAMGNRSLSLTKYHLRNNRLRGFYKGRTFKARVRKNGYIRFRNKLYRSPSLAAVKIVGRPINGWWFWHYERAPGDWLRLLELRK